MDFPSFKKALEFFEAEGEF